MKSFIYSSVPMYSNAKLPMKAIKNENDSIQIITGAEDVTNFTLKGYLRTKEKLDSCLDFVGPSVVATDQRIMKAALEMKERGIKIRLITDITKENINYCKDLMSLSEIRHLEGVKGNFGIIDEREYLMHIIHQDSQAPTQIIYTNDKSSAEAQQFLFNTLWNKAIPATARIKQIEDGIMPDFIEAIRDPFEIKKIESDIINSSNQEILVMFSTATDFHQQEQDGMLQVLEQAATEREIQVRVLTPMDDAIRETAHRLTALTDHFNMRPLGIEQGTKSTIITADGNLSLVIELNEDAKNGSTEAIALASYSNIKSTIWTYICIFENFWAQSDKPLH